MLAAVAAGWFAAVRGYPLVLVLVAAALVLLLFSPRLHSSSRKVPAKDLVAAQQQMQSMAERSEQLAEERVTAVARADAAASMVTQVEEMARATIVADLHDTVTQTVVAAAFASADPEVTREEIADMLRTAEAELRDVMLNSSPLRTTTSLAVLLERLMERMEERDELHVTLGWHLDPDLVLPHPTAIAVYRFIGEGLRNVARHAKTDRAQVQLESTGSDLVVSVSDDGCGYDTDVARPGRGMELLRARCAVVGGQVEVSSVLGAGTRTALRVPLM